MCICSVYILEEKKMKQYNYKEKNKYKGILMAKYEEEKKALEGFQERQRKELIQLNQDISEQKALIEKLEVQKQEALISGNQEEFLKVSDVLRKSNDSLEFYTKRKESLEEVARVKKEEIQELFKDTREEQNRLNKDSLQWLYEELKAVYSVLKEVHKELGEGDSILKSALDLFKKGNSEKEYNETIKKLPGYDSLYNNCSYPEKSIINLLGTIEGHLKYLEQDSMKKWLE